MKRTQSDPNRKNSRADQHIHKWDRQSIARKFKRKTGPVIGPFAEVYSLGRDALINKYWWYQNKLGNIPYNIASPFSLDPISNKSGRPKNVIWIMLDALRQDIFEEYLRRGGLADLTPGGAYFSHAFSQGSWTYPSIFSFLTGRYPFNCGTTRFAMENGNLVSICGDFDDECPTVFNVLRQQGYQIGSILEGWGFTLRKTAGQKHREDQYFEENWGWFHGQERRFLKLDELRTVSQNYVLKSVPQGPFMLFVRSMFTHSPYRGIFKSSQYVTQLSRRRWSYRIIEGFVRGLNYFERHYLKPLLASLAQTNQLDNTIIIICSDHGDMFWNLEDDLRSEQVDDEAWRHQLEPYNALMKVPLFIWGGKMKGVYSSRFRLVDVVPTLMDELALDIDAGNFDGISVRHNARRPLYADSAGYGHGGIAFQDSGAKLLLSNRLGQVAYKISEDEYEQLSQRENAESQVDELKEFIQRTSRFPLTDLDQGEDDALYRRLQALGYVE